MSSMRNYLFGIALLFSTVAFGQVAVVRSGDSTQLQSIYSTALFTAFPNGPMCMGVDGNNLARATRVDSSGNHSVVGTKTNNNAAPGATNVGALMCLANAAAPSWTEGNEVLASVDLAGNLRVIGSKTNNAAVPSTQLGVIPAVANASAPALTEGYQAALSTDLSGSARTNLTTRIAGENLSGVRGDISDFLEIYKSGTYTTAPTATTTTVAAGACTTVGGANCTIVYASTDYGAWPNVTITVRNSSAAVLTSCNIEWSPDGTNFELWDQTTFAGLAAGAMKSLSISGNSRRFLRIEAGAAAQVASAVVNVTANQN